MTDSNPITCDECQSRLEEFALDELAIELRARVAAHLADGCSVCNQRLGKIVSDFAQFAHALPMERPPMRVERGLLDRIAAQRVPREGAISVVPPVQSAKLSPKSLTRSLIAACLVLAATIVGIAAWTTRQNGLNGSATDSGHWAELQLRVDQADASQKFSAVPQMHFASLGVHTPDVPVEGYIVADRLAKQWHVYAFHLPALQKGRTYQLWFDVGNSRFLRAGTADVDDEGTISRLIDVPSDLLTIQGLAISDEASADSDHPTGENLVEAPLP